MVIKRLCMYMKNNHEEVGVGKYGRSFCCRASRVRSKYTSFCFATTHYTCWDLYRPLDAMAPLTPTQSLCSLDSHFDPFLEDDSELFLVSLQTKRKRVRIDTRAVRFDYVEHVSELTAEDRRQGWWSKDEYEATKLDAKNECRELRRSGIFKGCLTDAYEHACNIADNASGGCDDFKSKETTEHLAPPTVSADFMRPSDQLIDTYCLINILHILSRAC